MKYYRFLGATKIKNAMKMPLDLSIKRLHALSDIVVVKVTPIVQSSTFFLRHGEDTSFISIVAVFIYSDL